MGQKIGIVGATGAVGEELLRLLHDRAYPAESITLLASGRSAGKEIRFGGEIYTVREATPAAFDDLDLALFSAGASISKALAREAVRRGCVVIDNSSAFRMDEKVPLVIPEINAAAARRHDGIIANPNCSTAITLMGLWPLHRAFGLKRFVACTYQAVSGSGVQGMRELEDQLRAWSSGGYLRKKSVVILTKTAFTSSFPKPVSGTI